MTDTLFFCQACLVDRLVKQQSEDSRYCKDCCQFLLKEAKLDKSWGKATWEPVLKPLERKSEGIKDTGYMEAPARILSTSDEETLRVEKINPRSTTGGVRG